MNAVFLVGPPGVGKTTLARAVFAKLDPFGSAYLTVSPKWTVSAGCYAAAGHYSGGMFDGADTVPYSGAAAALEFLAEQLAEWRPRVVLFDGDRFSHAGALARVRELMPARVVLLAADGATLEARRAARGSSQSPQWMKGRATKARRFFDSFPTADRVELSAVAAIDKNTAKLLALASGP